MSSDRSEFSAQLSSLINLQRAAFIADGFPSAKIRIDRLHRAKRLLVENRDKIADALSADFGNRSKEQTIIGDIFSSAASLAHAAANVEAWMRAEKHEALAPDAEARIEYKPLGVVGVIGPWNFPYNLVFAPLAGIFAAGNRAILKPSEFTPAASELMGKLISDYFSHDEVAVVLGGAIEGAEFAAAAFDHLLFTGSTGVARHVMRAAAENLTPVTLELGGKSPVIVTDQFDLDEAAARIMAVKTFNAGQICLAPDYAYVPASSASSFTDACVSAVRTLFPDGMASQAYTTIITERHYERLMGLVEDARAKGAQVIQAFPEDENRSARRFPPTLIVNPPEDAKVMQEEIFGPILPILTYSDLGEVVQDIRARPHPLALYYFGKDDAHARRVLDGTTSGGVTINDVMAHVYAEGLPFGGVGPSGMGSYHGKAGFLTFSHARSVYRQSAAQEAVMLIRPPYTDVTRQFLDQAFGTTPAVE
jgi:coniferyl-aldehyde dehydrogenase